MLHRILICLLMLLFALPALASNGPRVAFSNSSGQLVVASADGAARWIVTNPGEVLHSTLGFSWSPDQGRLFFAVDYGSVVSLRIGEPATMNVVEIAQVSGALSGGVWRDADTVLVAVDGRVIAYGPGSPQTVLEGAGSITLVSPYATDRPGRPGARSVSPDGLYLFYWQGNSQFLQLYGDTVSVALPGTAEPAARNSGLWADDAPFVAYWGLAGDGTSTLSVTGAASGQTVTLRSGRSAPITPVAWRPGSTQLLYRDASPFIRLADLDCLHSGCAANPLENGLDLLPDSASEVQMLGDWLFFRDGEAVRALHLACVENGSCAGQALTLGQNAAPRTSLHAAGTTLVYTAYARSAADANDREIRLIDLRCLSDPATCAPRTLLSGAVAGLVSPDGAYMVADLAENGLHAVRMLDLSQVYLSAPLGPQPGTGVLGARWR